MNDIRRLKYGGSILPVFFILFSLFFSLSATAADHVAVNPGDGGRILNCFGWRYKTITDRLQDIKAAGYSAVQVTTVQPLPKATEFDGKYTFPDALSTPVSDWYRIYAPTALRLITAADNTGCTPLGTRAEFNTLVSAAHAAGLGIVAGVEANQLYKGSATAASVTVTAYKDVNVSGNEPDFKDPTRKSFTERAINPAVEDIVYVGQSGYEDVQKVVTFVRELYAAGVDGICWYHAKYIPLEYGQAYSNRRSSTDTGKTGYDMAANPAYTSLYKDGKAEGSSFWPSVYEAMNEDAGGTALSVPMFSYVNLNLDPNCKGERFRNNSNVGYTIDHDPSYFDNGLTDEGSWHRPLREYTKYNRVVDSWYAKSAMMQDGVSFADGYWTGQQATFKYHKDFSNNEITGAYAAEPTDMVYLAEDQDTYLNNPEVMFEPMVKANAFHENRETSNIASSVADRVYADMAAHNGVTTVYFARPFSTSGSFKLGEDLADLSSTYAYFEDTNNWTGGDPKKLTVSVTIGTVTTTNANDLVNLVGTHNGHNVYLWRYKGEGTPEKVQFKAGNGSTPVCMFNNTATYDATAEMSAMASLPDVSETDPTTDDMLTVYINDNIGRAEDERDLYVFPNKLGGFTGWSWPGKKLTAEKSVVNGGRTWYYMRVPKNIWENVLYGETVIVSAWKKGTTNFTDDNKIGQTDDINEISTDQWFVISDNDISDKKLQYRDVRNISLPYVSNEPLRYKSAAITAVNNYHRLLNGEREYKDAAFNPDGTRINVASICRHNGAVIVIRDPGIYAGKHNVANAGHYLSASDDGSSTYTDHVTGNTFNVTTDKINGEIGRSGIVVLYNDDDLANTNVKVDPITGISNGTQSVNITPSTGVRVQYRIANNKAFSNENNLGWWGPTQYIAVYNPDTKRYEWRSASSIAFTYDDDGGYVVNKASDWQDVPDDNKIDLKYSDYKLSYLSSNNSGYYLMDPSYTYIYLQVRYSTDGGSNWTNLGDSYSYKLNTSNSSDVGTLYCNTLYFNLPDGVDPNRLTISAWNDDGGRQMPLTQAGGDKLQKYYSTTEEQQAHWYRPCSKIYEYETTTDSDGREKIDDKNYAVMIGTAYVADADKYDPDKGVSYNDAVPIGHGRYVCRYTVGVPNLHFDNIKFRLSYDHPQGYTEQLEVMELGAGEDQFYSISQDDEGRLSMGHDVEMLGDAIYDNSTWGYRMSGVDDNMTNELANDGNPSQNWKSGFWDGFNDSDPTRLRFEPNESNRLSVGGTKAEVYTWSGQMIHGNTLRFGMRPDFAVSFIPDEEKNKTNTDKFKRYLKPEPTMYKYKINKATYVDGLDNSTDNWFMDRGMWTGKGSYPVLKETYDDNGNVLSRTWSKKTFDELQWTWPSGFYEVKFYHLSQADEDTYYMTVSQPTIKYEKSEGTEYKEGATSDIVTDKLENPTMIGNTGWFYLDLAHLGKAGYRGSTVTISNNVTSEPEKFRAPTFILEGKDSVSSSSVVTDDYSSPYPETGAYRIAYSVGHGNDPKVPVSRETSLSTDAKISYQTSNGKADTEPTAKYMLGFGTMRYSKEDLLCFRTTDERDKSTHTVPESYWATYSDGLPRIKPAGVTAYYATGYVRGVAGSEKPIQALYFTKLEGDTLPANTGLMLQIDVNSVPTLNQGGDVPGMTDRKYLYLEPAKVGRDYVVHQAGTNFMQPWIAADESVSNTSDNAWRQYPDVKRPGSKFLNYQFSYGYITVNERDADGKLIGTTDKYGVGFYPTVYRYPTNNYEVRKAFVSIPRSGVIADDPGDDDQTFTAKRRYTEASAGSDVVMTAPVDLIWGDDGGAYATGIRSIVADDDSNESEERVFNLQGQRVSSPHHGIFIRGGKKIIIR